MTINPSKCVACGNCTYVCPMGAIYIDPQIRRATINRNECVECYACYNGMSQEHLNPTMVPNRQNLENAALLGVLAPSAEEQRLSALYLKRGLTALTEELKRF